jgi:hypothetical protein
MDGHGNDTNVIQRRTLGVLAVVEIAKGRMGTYAA